MMPKPGGVTLVFGKLQRKTSGGPGTLLCLSIVIFISRSHSSFLRTYILPQSFFSFFVLLFISHSLRIVLLHAPSSLRPFDESYMPPPQELCLLAVSYFLPATSPTSSSSATKMAGFHYCVSPGWAPGPVSHCTLDGSPVNKPVDFSDLFPDVKS